MHLPNLYLLGFMGTGKSVVGRAVAQRLQMDFLDVDDLIAQKTGISIEQIFATYGEVHFRQLEQAVINDGHPVRNCVVACGGGILTSNGMLEKVHLKGVPVVLLANVGTLVERLEGENNFIKRPLLKIDNLKECVKTLLATRLPLYEAIDLKVTTDGKAVNGVAEEVIELYQTVARGCLI